MKRPLTIEIHGTGTHNRGAELMAIAILQHCREAFPGVRMVVQPPFGTFQDRARHGVEITWQFPGPRATFSRGWYVKYAPKMLHETAGIISPADVDVVLDASGFAFGDQWGTLRSERLWRKMTTRERRHQRLILLPQALGPFRDAKVRRSAAKLFRRADLIFARDSVSEANLQDFVNASKVRKSPDFTAQVAGVRCDNIDIPEDFVAICPNYKMLKMHEWGGAYLEMLALAVKYLKSRGMNPGFVLHEEVEDQKMVEMFFSRNERIPVIFHDDPRVLKWVLGQAELVIGSRFHALVGALSQGIPCIGLGWSHKYPELFRDYNCEEFILNDLTDHRKMEDMIDLLTRISERHDVSGRIRSRANRIYNEIQEMWIEVDTLIRSKIA